jgi:SAM-dependent methyltransferase
MFSSARSSTGFTRWLGDLEARHLRDMTTSEVARALRALSSTYVERRSRLSDRGAFDTAGKRAAYALYYAPRRFLTVAHVLAAVEAPTTPLQVVDLGCGTGAAGAAWAVHAGAGSSVLGVDVHPWALEETRATLRGFGLQGQTRRLAVGAAAALWKDGKHRSDTTRATGIALSYVVNELDGNERAALLAAVMEAARHGTRVFVMEPLSRRTSPWWNGWVDTFTAAGGRADEWRVRIEPPPVTLALGVATGLDAVEATGRTLWI